MALPEHKYYTLSQAAKKAGCEIADLIHFAAIGVLQLCIKIPVNGFTSYDEDTEEAYNVSISPEYVFDEEKVTHPEGEEPLKNIFCEYRSDYLYIAENKNLITGLISTNRIDGLVALYSSDIEEVEFELLSAEYGVNVIQLSTPRVPKFSHSEHYWAYGFSLSNPIYVELNQLLITKYEFNLLMDGGQILEGEVFKTNDSPTPKKEHPNAERHAKNREQLYKQAICVLLNHRDECKGSRGEITLESWANAIVNHQKDYGYLAITNHKIIERHLGKAMKV